MKLYNTLTRSVETFTPLRDNMARIYSCGPTVYDHAHIGNLSAYIFADTLHRALRAAGCGVQHVMNYTDVDDKTIRRSKEQHPDKEPRQALHILTDHYINIFLKDMLQIGNDTTRLQFIRATDDQTIAGMQQLITRLHDKGFAYIADDGVYFSIEAYRKSGKIYGQLLEISVSNTSAARIQNDEYDKESVHDFALWKKQKDSEPAWEFVLEGHDLTGRPGWHIECSVMSRRGLGQPFDIHTGGIDLIFPHHENEIAQSTAAEEDPTMARFFCHNDHILVNGKKMAKSANNFFTLEDIIKKGYEPLAFRLLVLQAHYRSQVNFTWESLEAAQNRLNNWRAVAALRWQPIEPASQEAQGTQTGDSLNDYEALIKNDLHTALFEDLNTPQVLAHVSQRLGDLSEHLVSQQELLSFGAYLTAIDTVLGLDLMAQPDISEAQKQLIVQREATRGTKGWAASDALRDQLKDQGIGLRDTPSGPIWYR